MHLDRVEGDAGGVELAQEAGHGGARRRAPGRGRAGPRPPPAPAVERDGDRPERLGGLRRDEVATLEVDEVAGDLRP